MKKFVVFGFILLIGCCFSAFAQTETDFTVGLTEDGEGVVIKEYKGKTVKVIIPAAIQGMPVTEIGEQAFAGGGVRSYTRPIFRTAVEITSVVIPDGVTIIRNTAFGSQQKLNSITIPNTVTSIGARAFRDCVALLAITIPNSVTNIGASAFEDCTKLESITIPDSVTAIGDRAFAGSGLKSIAWPASVTNIQATDTYGGMGMFTGCKNLQTMIIPEGVTEIGSCTFRGCSTLTSVTLPSTFEKIGGDAFSGCSALTTIVIPDSVGNITFDSSSFRGCPNLTLASQAAVKKRGYTGSF
ncbi:MAG: leucine-rich repeat domain-containing protein [Spirochaetales bacterium]|jgi:hypothetical protein|nr:leucine-rich repeat domain-containing protein [Spirochaetales bacterium]